jgi:hypothetical protein
MGRPKWATLVGHDKITVDPTRFDRTVDRFWLEPVRLVPANLATSDCFQEPTRTQHR